jgi:hypothetical protein
MAVRREIARDEPFDEHVRPVDVLEGADGADDVRMRGNADPRRDLRAEAVERRGAGK